MVDGELLAHGITIDSGGLESGQLLLHLGQLGRLARGHGGHGGGISTLGRGGGGLLQLLQL